MLYSGLYFGRDLPADSEEAKLPLHGPNQWLPEVPSSPLLYSAALLACCVAVHTNLVGGTAIMLCL